MAARTGPLLKIKKNHRWNNSASKARQPRARLLDEQLACSLIIVMRALPVGINDFAFICVGDMSAVTSFSALRDS